MPIVNPIAGFAADMADGCRARHRITPATKVV